MSSSLRPLFPTLSVGRSFSTTSPHRASILFALGALSNSRETQHFNKFSRLDRVEHSPPLKLIKTSEIDPFPLPPPPRTATQLIRNGTRASAAALWDRKALQAGRTILSNNARELSRMSRALERTKRREMKAKHSRQSELAAWAQERQKMRAEQRRAGVLILAAVATTTGLAMWRFWPDSGMTRRRIAERARASMPLPAVRSAGQSAHAVPVAAAAEAASIEALPVTGVSTPIVGETPGVVASEPARSWSWTLRNMFWKVQ